MIYKATFEDDNGSLIDEGGVGGFFEALRKKGYEPRVPITEAGCVSFYVVEPIEESDMVVAANA